MGTRASAASQQDTAAGADPPGLGARIRAARLQRGMSLAQMGGGELSPSFLSMVERDKCRVSVRALSLIAERLELPASYFMDDASDLPTAELALQRAEIDLLRGEHLSCLDRLNRTDLRESLGRRALWLRGCALIGCGRPEEAVGPLQEALTVCTERHDLSLLPDIEYGLAEALLQQRSYEDALAHARSALAAAEECPDNPLLKGNVLMLMGDILHGQGRHEFALDAYARALETTDAVDDLSTLASVYDRVSRGYEARGSREPSVRFAAMAAAALRAQQDAARGAQHLVVVAERYRDRGRLDRACGYAHQSVERARLLGRLDLEHRGRLILAAVALAHHDVATAAREAETVLDASDEGTAEAAAAGVILAALAATKQDTNHAAQLYRRSLDTFMRLGRYRQFEEAAAEFSRFLRQQGDVEQALEYALLAIDARGKAAEAQDESS